MTSQLPWFPFNASAFSSSRRVRRLTDLQFRVYLLALCEMWQRGALEDDPEEWRVLGFDPDAIEHLKKVGLLQVGPKGLVNPRLEGCRREADERAETARRNGRKGGRPRKERDESVASEPNGNPVGLRPVPRATPAINTDRAPSDPDPEPSRNPPVSQRDSQTEPSEKLYTPTGVYRETPGWVGGGGPSASPEDGGRDGAAVHGCRARDPAVAAAVAELTRGCR